MKKFVKYFALAFLILIFISILLFKSVEARIFDKQSLNWADRKVGVIIQRVSDLVHYLIMQKKYIFDDFSDPNVYDSLVVPADLEEVLTASSSPAFISVAKEPISTEVTKTPVLKDVQIETPIQERFAYSVPVLVNESRIDSSEEFIPSQTENSQILNYTNRERNSHGLKSLSFDSTLETIANLRIDDLFAKQYFEHESAHGKSAPDLAITMNYSYLLIGENLAMGNFADSEEIVSAWMESPGHRANILNKQYTRLGTALKEGQFNGEKTIIAVQIFSLPMSDCPNPSREMKSLVDKTYLSVQQMQEQALAMFNNLNTIKNSTDLDKSFYYQKVQEYNYFAKKVNDAVLALENMINLYNIEVGRYNTCIAL